MCVPNHSRSPTTTTLSPLSSLPLSRSGVHARELWDSDAYIGASLLHKLVAVIYYYNNMNTVMKLGDASLYSKSAWVQLFAQGNAAVSSTTRNPMQNSATAN